MIKAEHLDISKKEILDALINFNGIVTNACSSVGLSRATYYYWLNNDADFKRQVDDIQEVALDFVEAKLFNLIAKDDTAATIFYLKSKGKKRGYIERMEVDNMGSLSIMTLDPLNATSSEEDKSVDN